MRHHKIVVLMVCSFLFLTGCEKEVIEQLPLSKSQTKKANNFQVKLGSMHLKYNGVPYDYTSNSATVNQYGALSLSASKSFHPVMQLYESILFTKIPIKKGKYYSSRPHLTEPTFFTGLVLDDDAIINTYQVDSTHVNFVELTHIDTLNQRVRGSFQAKFLNPYPGYSWDNWPDTIDITDGRFYLEYIK